MRIRKNARLLSVLSFSDGSIARPSSCNVKTHVCELNRSPWDEISFPPQSDEYQVEIKDRIARDAVGVESVNDFESVASLMEEENWEVKAKEEEKNKEEEEEKDDDDHDGGGLRFSLLADVKKPNRQKKRISGGGFNRGKKGELMKKNYTHCNKTDGKGWQCRREAKQGHLLCEHHLTQLRSYHYNYRTHSGRKSAVDNQKSPDRPSRRRNRPDNSKTLSSSSVVNLSDFYYYSGFGPSWGKKRSVQDQASNRSFSTEIFENLGDTALFASVGTTIPSSSHNHGDFIDDSDEEDEDSCHEVPRKNTRKPIKARSLKSLLY